MKYLLTINNYDKPQRVRAWIEQARSSLDQKQWAIQVITSGPITDGFEAETIHVDNPSSGVGYFNCLSGARPDEDTEVVVSVHAKTSLNSLQILKDMASEISLGFADGLFTEKFGFQDNWKGPERGESCFLFAVSADLYREIIGMVHHFRPGWFPEVFLGGIVDAMQLTFKIRRMPGKHERRGPNYRILGLDNKCDLYGIESPWSDS
jgi:hypothetical protein